jgi:hypothetical protein
MDNRKYGSLSSWQDPTKVATTVKGIVLSLSSLLLVILPLAGISITAEQITTLAGNLGLAAGAVATLYGLGMKVVVYFSERKTETEE